MTDTPMTSLDFRRMRTAITSASAKASGNRTDKLGAFLDELHRNGFALVAIPPVEDPPEPEAEG